MIGSCVGSQVDAFNAVNSAGALNIANSGIADQRKIKIETTGAAHANGVDACTTIDFGKLIGITASAKLILQGGDHAAVDREYILAHSA